MKKLITILAIIMSCFIITSCDEKEEKIKSTSNSQSIWAGVYSFTEYDDDGNALYKAQLTVTKLTDEEFLKSGPNGVVEDDSKSENNEKIKNASENILKVSALNKTGLEELYNKITEMFNLNEIMMEKKKKLI